MSAGSTDVPDRPSAPDDGARVGIRISQRLLRHASTIPLARRCTRIVASSSFARRCVVAVLDDAIAAFDLARPDAPAVAWSAELEGVRGALDWRGRLLAFGEGGFTSIDRERGVEKVGPDGPCDEILDAVLGAGAWFVLDPTALCVRTAKLCPLRTVDFEGGRCLLRLGRRIVAGGCYGIAVFDATIAAEPQLEARLDGVDVAELCLAPERSGAALVAVLEDGSARAYAIRDGELRATASYPARPWFADAVRFGDLLVRVGADRSALDVGVLGPAQLVDAAAMRSA